MVRVTAETDPHGGGPATGYRNWTQHPNNPMAKPAAGIAPAASRPPVRTPEPAE
jgi:dihydropyrimidine dehydrogenase (NAD+) subunit PreA